MSLQTNSSLLRSIVRFPASLSGWCVRFWVDSGFAVSAGMCRMAVGLAMLRTFTQSNQLDYKAYLSAQDPALYNPIGILVLFGNEVPSAAFFHTCQIAAPIAIWCMIAGVLTRLSSLVSVFCLTCLASLNYSHAVGWSHGANIVLLAGIAIMFAGGGPISLDRYLAARLRVPGRDSRRPPMFSKTSVLLGQFAVALVFFNAGMWKTVLSGHGLSWALSDNLRNILQLQYWVLNQPLPAWAEIVVAHEWIYKGLALGNLITQLLPMLAFLFVRRPWLRLTCGMFFVIEVCALHFVMRMDIMHWIWLIAFFVDWDRLAGALVDKLEHFRARRFGLAKLKTFLSQHVAPRSTAATTLPTSRRRSNRLATGMQLLVVAGFVGFSTYVAFGQHVPKRYSYPFTSYPMYSYLYLEKPYHEHRPFFLRASTWEITSEPPLSQEAYSWVWTNYYQLPWYVDDPRPVMSALRANLEQLYGVKVQSIAVDKTMYEFLAYPATGVEPTVGACYYDDTGGDAKFVENSLHTDPSNGRMYVTATPHGFDDYQLSFAYYHRNTGELNVLPGEWQGERFYFAKEHSGTYLIVILVHTGNETRRCCGPILY